MSKISLAPNASGTGTLTISAPNTNTDRAIALPDAAGTVFVSGQALSATTGSFSGNVTLGSSVLATPTGSAPSYTCRAWVNFNGTGTVAIRASGNLGVGTTSPSYKLHVDGDIYATGNVIANNISGVPAGSIIFHAASSAPTGYLKANGAAVSRSTYSALFSAIGTTFGAGDGSTTFNLPDLRGEFLRGWDDSRGVDSGRSLGSYQSSQNLSHTHSGSAASTSLTGGINARGGSSFPSMDGVFSGSNATTAYNGSYNARTEYTRANFNGTHSHSLSINSDGGGESRPRNIALLACIKY